MGDLSRDVLDMSLNTHMGVFRYNMQWIFDKTCLPRYNRRIRSKVFFVDHDGTWYAELNNKDALRMYISRNSKNTDAKVLFYVRICDINDKTLQHNSGEFNCSSEDAEQTTISIIEIKGETLQDQVPDNQLVFIISFEVHVLHTDELMYECDECINEGLGSESADASVKDIPNSPTRRRTTQCESKLDQEIQSKLKNPSNTVKSLSVTNVDSGLSLKVSDIESDSNSPTRKSTQGESKLQQEFHNKFEIASPMKMTPCLIN